MKNHLFVYGTLRKDVWNSKFHFLEGFVQFVGYGCISGRLYDLGHFPGAVLSENGDSSIHGEVYILKNNGNLLARLEEYEGCGPYEPRPHLFERVLKKIALEDGKGISGWVYVYKGTFEERQMIQSGNYLEAT